METLEIVHKASSIFNSPMRLPCVIVEMPLSQLRMFSVCCVVSTVEGPTVVGDGVAVVGGAGQAVRVLGKAQTIQGEGDC